MALHSMTGFAEAQGSEGSLSWRWELRGVNGRGLDMRLRLPNGFESLDPAVRERLRKRLARGSVSVGFSYAREAATSVPTLNVEAFTAALGALDAAADQLGQPRPDRTTLDPMRLIAMRGLIDTNDASADLADIPTEAILASFDAALSAFIASRAEEGARLADLIADQMGQVAALADDARAAPQRQPDAIKARLRAQIERLFSADGNRFDPDRLHQEAMLLAAKADIQEELDRLDGHVDAVRGLMNGSGPCGRKLDFLSQEFNREANTLCSKANDPAITAIGLDMKAVIDQFKEQVQNIE
ncbi:MAG: YicC/YloC family endoribonuclease [Pseudomonadota bacterium]